MTVNTSVRAGRHILRLGEAGTVLIGLLVSACASGSTATPGILPPATPRPKVNLFQVPTPDSFDAGITAGPDGNIWFVEGAINVNKISRLNLKDDSITEFPLTGCGSGGEYIAPGSDGNVWASQYCFTNHEPPQGYPEMAKVAPDGSMQLIQINTIDQPFHETAGQSC